MNGLDLLLASTDAVVVDRHDIAAVPERLSALPPSFQTEQLIRWTGAMTNGRERVWLHQAMAWEILQSDKNVVLATGTGSGKSLVFQGEMVRRLLDDPEATGFALYPARALASDQLHRWKQTFREAGLDEDLVVEVSRNTPASEREAYLKRARVIVGTEDIVHAWFMRLIAAPEAQRFVRHLGLVIIDEAHNLDGVFGSNCALLFRRLRAARVRSLKNAGASRGELQFIAASATLADPASHLQALTGLPFEVIGEDDNGAPRQAKTLLHIEGPEFGMAGETALTELVERLADKIGSDALIAFADGRKVVENVTADIGSDQVEPYRAGFEKDDRAAIEKAMHDGSLRAVVATSSLELGIDVPAFTIGLNLGIPMSRKAFRQRVGRIGRASESVFAVIAEPSAFAKLGTSLREFFEGAAEDSPLYLDNKIVQFQNACCLLAEGGGEDIQPDLTTGVEWPAGFADACRMALPGAIRPAEIDHVARNGSWGAPHLDFPLRRIGDGTFVLRLHGGDGEILGTIDDAKALREAYPGGTYRHRKVAYRVVEWRQTGYERSIYLRRLSGGARTTPIVRTNVGISHEATEIQERRLLAGDRGSLAEIRMQVGEAVIGYRFGKTDLLYRDLSQKDRHLTRKQRHFSTTGIAIRIDEPWFKGTSGAPAEIREQIGRALTTVLVRERGISASEVRWEHAGIAIHGSGGPRVLDDALVIFDDLPGGLRLTSPLFVEFEHFLDRLHRGAELAGADALLDEISVARLERWYRALGSAPGEQSLRPLQEQQRLIYAVGSRVGVRINGTLLERTLTGHQLVRVAETELLVYQYESAPGVLALVPHDQIEPFGNEWRRVVWDTHSDTIEEVAA